jgi:NADH:ubiquinone reductase (non-electrogenic)
VKKIKDVLGDICERYPQVELYLKSNQMKGFHDLLKDSDGNSKELKELDIEHFKKALAQVDSQVKMLPATAQVIHMHQSPYSRNCQDNFCALYADILY